MTAPLTDSASQASPDEIPEEIKTVQRLRALREQVTTQMGGPDAIKAIHAKGRRTAREHIAQLVDPGSFGEIGVFATFVDKVTAPDPGPYGGGIIGGHATIDGRPVTVAVDDDSVTAPDRRSTGKAARPGKTGTPNARTFGAEPAFPYLLERRREIPVVSMVLGDTSGASACSAGRATSWSSSKVPSFPWAPRRPPNRTPAARSTPSPKPPTRPTR